MVVNNQLEEVVSVSDLKVGDTVKIGKDLHTVNANDLKYCSFMGHSFKGSVYPNGITIVKFQVLTKNGLVLR